MNILITGAGGQLAQSIKDIAKNYKKFNFDFFTEQDLNLLDFEKLINVTANKKYDVVINCAAYTDVELSEAKPGKAKSGNAIIAKNLAKAAKNNNFFLVHFSTDYVFDGKGRTPFKEEDTTIPQNIYGITKLLGEKYISKSKANACIIRTSWLYSIHGNNFVKTMLKLGKEKEIINVVNDQIGCPTSAHDLAKHLLDILPKVMNKKGINIYHYCNKGFTTWFDFAKNIMEMANLNCNINPVSSFEFRTIAKRPVFSVLDTSKIVEEFDITIPQWQDSLKNCINLLQE